MDRCHHEVPASLRCLQRCLIYRINGEHYFEMVLQAVVLGVLGHVYMVSTGEIDMHVAKAISFLLQARKADSHGISIIQESLAGVLPCTNH